MMRMLIILLCLGFASTLPAQQVTEICDNGIDDDGDGLIDCEDLDCRIGYFVESGQAIGPNNYVDGGLGDLDGDGDLDIVALGVGLNETQFCHILINTGIGTFETIESR